MATLSVNLSFDVKAPLLSFVFPFLSELRIEPHHLHLRNGVLVLTRYNVV
jgi:hypothetical protein